jgi:hypothetical protein
MEGQSNIPVRYADNSCRFSGADRKLVDSAPAVARPFSKFAIVAVELEP